MVLYHPVVLYLWPTVVAQTDQVRIELGQSRGFAGNAGALPQHGQARNYSRRLEPLTFRVDSVQGLEKVNEFCFHLGGGSTILETISPTRGFMDYISDNFAQKFQISYRWILSRYVSKHAGCFQTIVRPYECVHIGHLYSNTHTISKKWYCNWCSQK